MNVPLLAALGILGIGFVGVLAGRNLLKTLVGVELMSKAALVNFVATDAASQGIVVLLILVDAIVVAVVMAMAVSMYRQYDTLDLDAMGAMTW